MRSIFTLLIVIIAVPLMAQEEVLELDSLIEITAEKLEDRPAFHTIDSKGLDITNQVEVHTVLNQVPGLFMHSGTLSTNRITIRGVGNRSPFSTSKIRAYLNEIPLTSGIGETSLEDIDLSLIGDIELWKGPTASRYGAALGGMIHYKTRAPQQLGESTLITSQISLGSFGLFRNSNTLHLDLNEKMSLRINNNTTSTSGWRENSNYRRQGAAMLMDYKSENYTINSLFNFVDLLGQIPSSLNRTDFESNPEKAAFSWKEVEGYEDYQKLLAGISFETHREGNWQILSSLSYNRKRGYESRPFNILDDVSNAFNGRFIASNPANAGSVKLGAELFTESYKWITFETDLGVQGDLLETFDERRNYINIFAEYSRVFTDKMRLETGLNLNKTAYSISDPGPGIPDQYDYNWVLSPQVSLRIQQNDLLNFYFLVSHGLSVPTLEETLTPDGLINEDIAVEKGLNFEIGSRGSNPTGRAYYDISVYNMLLSDVLVTRFEPDINTGIDQIIAVNAGNTNHFGIDLKAKLQLHKGDQSSLDYQVAYSYQHYIFRDFIEGDSDFSGNPLTGSIPHRTFSQLVYNRGAFSFQLIHEFVDGMPMRDDNSIRSDPYNLLHLKSSADIISSESVKLNLSAGLNNLLDQTYASMVLVNAGSFGGNLPRYYYPGNPINFYVTAQLRLLIK